MFKESSRRLLQGTWLRSAVEPGPASNPLSLAPAAGPGPVMASRGSLWGAEGRLQGVMLPLEGRKRPVAVPRACPSQVAGARGAWVVEQDWSGAGGPLSWRGGSGAERPGVGCALRDVQVSDPARFLLLPMPWRAHRPNPSSVLGVTAHRTFTSLSWMFSSVVGHVGLELVNCSLNSIHGH